MCDFGAKFDYLRETLNLEAWNKAFDMNKFDLKEYVNKEYDLNENFVWDNILTKDTKEILVEKYKRILGG